MTPRHQSYAMRNQRLFFQETFHRLRGLGCRRLLTYAQKNQLNAFVYNNLYGFTQTATATHVVPVFLPERANFIIVA